MYLVTNPICYGEGKTAINYKNPNKDGYKKCGVCMGTGKVLYLHKMGIGP